MFIIVLYKLITIQLNENEFFILYTDIATHHIYLHIFNYLFRFRCIHK